MSPSTANIPVWLIIAAGLLLLVLLVYLIARLFARRSRYLMHAPTIVREWEETESTPPPDARPPAGAPPPAKKAPDETQHTWLDQPPPTEVPNEGPPAAASEDAPEREPAPEPEPEDLPGDVAAAPEMFGPATAEPDVDILRSPRRELVGQTISDFYGEKIRKTVEDRQQRSERGQYTVWFGTNRKIVDSNDLEHGFTNERTDNINGSTVLALVSH